MKRSLLALAVLGAFSGTTLAQSSVTLYGIADVNLTRAKGGADTLTTMGSGGLNGSRWGLRGTEDLGGGLKANFVLESGFATDTGAGLQGALFGRSAWVGISGNFGQTRFGRQLTPIGSLADETSSFGTKGADVLAVTGSLAANAAYRTNNAMTYVSPSLGGLTVTGQYSLGLANEPTAAQGDLGEHYGLSALYKAGPIQAGIGYLHIVDNNAAPGDQRQRAGLVYGGYNFGFATVKASYYEEGRGGDKMEVYGLNFDVPVGAAVVTAGISQANNVTNASVADDDALIYNLQGVYDLSKRTALYAFYTYVDNDAGAALGYNNPAFDKASSLFQVGIRHRF